jgi:hypothetical protein
MASAAGAQARLRLLWALDGSLEGCAERDGQGRSATRAARACSHRDSPKRDRQRERAQQLTSDPPAHLSATAGFISNGPTRRVAPSAGEASTSGVIGPASATAAPGRSWCIWPRGYLYAPYTCSQVPHRVNSALPAARGALSPILLSAPHPVTSLQERWWLTKQRPCTSLPGQQIRQVCQSRRAAA